MNSTLNVEKIIQETENDLDDLTRTFSTQLIYWMKQKIEIFVVKMLGYLPRKLEVGMVVDTNIVIKALKRYVKGKTGILFKLLNNPIFTLNAPKEIEFEVMRYPSTNKDIDINRWRKGWIELKRIIRIDGIRTEEAKHIAKKIIGQRDPRDVPFVAMYLDLGASAILTDDKDFEHPSLIKTKIEGLGDLVGKYNRGLFSFVIISELTPATLQLLSQLAILAIKTLFQGLKVIFELVSAIMNNATNDLARIVSEIPTEIKDSLIALGLVVAIIFVLNENFRNHILTSIDQLAKSVLRIYGPLVDRLVEWINDGIEAIKNYVQSLVTIVVAVMPILAIKLIVIFNNIKTIVNAILAAKSSV